MILADQRATGDTNFVFRLNGDTGSNYAQRASYNGGTDGTSGSNSGLMGNWGSAITTNAFHVGYLTNLAAKEKLAIFSTVRQQAAGAGYYPDRQEGVGKHAQTSNAVSAISMTNTDTGGYLAESEVVVLGWDPEDTHTTNFWAELSSTTLGSANATIDSGTITAKKYLWFQVFSAGSTASNRCHVRINSVSTGIYVDRYSSDGASDATDVNSGSSRISNINDTNPKFLSGFIINTAETAKLGIASEVTRNSSGSGSATQRTESVIKITTDTQATSLQIINLSGNWSAGSILKVWGSD